MVGFLKLIKFTLLCYFQSPNQSIGGLKAIVHGPICMIPFVWLLFGFKIPSYKCEEIELTRVMQILSCKLFRVIPPLLWFLFRFCMIRWIWTCKFQNRNYFLHVWYDSARMIRFLKDKMSSVSSHFYEESLKLNKSHTNRTIEIFPCNTTLRWLSDFKLSL